MPEPEFFPRREALSLDEVVATLGVPMPETGAPIAIRGVALLDEAGPTDLSFVGDPHDAAALSRTRAGICLVRHADADRVPTRTIGIVLDDPRRGFAAIVRRLYPSALRPGSLFSQTGVSPESRVHPTARLEQGVTIDPGALVGPDAEIGRGTVIGAGALIGPQVRVGRDCAIGPATSLMHALLGNRVVLQPGARVGQGGSGHALLEAGEARMPQLGRAILQDDVEIGANATVERGAERDTIIGEGTRIADLVHIGGSTIVGRFCSIAAQAGVSSFATLGDHVTLGAQVRVGMHARIGDGARVKDGSRIGRDLGPEASMP